MRKLTPLGLALVVIAIVAAFAVGMAIAGRIMGEDLGKDLTQVFREPSETSISEVVFPENGAIHAAIGGEAMVRLAVIIGSERAVAVACPPGFKPNEYATYVVEPVRLETVDGRLAPTVWVLRSSERTANTTK